MLVLSHGLPTIDHTRITTRPIRHCDGERGSFLYCLMINLIKRTFFFFFIKCVLTALTRYREITIVGSIAIQTLSIEIKFSVKLFTLDGSAITFNIHRALSCPLYKDSTNPLHVCGDFSPLRGGAIFFGSL